MKILDRMTTNWTETGEIKTTNEDTMQRLKKFKDSLQQAFDSASDLNFAGITDKIWSFGPKRIGPNILVNGLNNYDRTSVWASLAGCESRKKLRKYDSSIVLGFQLATLAGPLCEEPMMGVCFVVEEWTVNHQIPQIDEETEPLSSLTQVQLEDGTVSVGSGALSLDGTWPAASSDDANSQSSYVENKPASTDTSRRPFKDRGASGSLTGRVVTCMKECCRRAFQSQPQRLMAAMYTCNIQVTADVLGMYSHVTTMKI